MTNCDEINLNTDNYEIADEPADCEDEIINPVEHGPESSDGNTPVIIGSAVAAGLVLIIVIILIVCIRKRRCNGRGEKVEVDTENNNNLLHDGAAQATGDNPQQPFGQLHQLSDKRRTRPNPYHDTHLDRQYREGASNFNALKGNTINEEDDDEENEKAQLDQYHSLDEVTKYDTIAGAKALPATFGKLSESNTGEYDHLDKVTVPLKLPENLSKGLAVGKEPANKTEKDPANSLTLDKSESVYTMAKGVDDSSPYSLASNEEDISPYSLATDEQQNVSEYPYETAATVQKQDDLVYSLAEDEDKSHSFPNPKEAEDVEYDTLDDSKIDQGPSKQKGEYDRIDNIENQSKSPDTAGYDHLANITGIVVTPRSNNNPGQGSDSSPYSLATDEQQNVSEYPYETAATVQNQDDLVYSLAKEEDKSHSFPDSKEAESVEYDTLDDSKINQGPSKQKGEYDRIDNIENQSKSPDTAGYDHLANITGIVVTQRGDKNPGQGSDSTTGAAYDTFGALSAHRIKQDFSGYDHMPEFRSTVFTKEQREKASNNVEEGVDEEGTYEMLEKVAQQSKNDEDPYSVPDEDSIHPDLKPIGALKGNIRQEPNSGEDPYSYADCEPENANYEEAAEVVAELDTDSNDDDDKNAYSSTADILKSEGGTHGTVNENQDLKPKDQQHQNMRYRPHDWWARNKETDNEQFVENLEKLTPAGSRLKSKTIMRDNSLYEKTEPKPSMVKVIQNDLYEKSDITLHKVNDDNFYETGEPVPPKVLVVENDLYEKTGISDLPETMRDSNTKLSRVIVIENDLYNGGTPESSKSKDHREKSSNNVNMVENELYSRGRPELSHKDAEREYYNTSHVSEMKNVYEN